MKERDIARPTPAQVAWQDLEFGMFIHMEHARDDRPHEVPPAADFNPKKLDTDQWLEAAKACGAKLAVFTAKHAGGFCMWPTEGLDYSVKQSPWRGGKGDIVGDFVNSCHKYGILPGLYIMYQPNHHFGWIKREWEGDPAEFERYQQAFELQVTELCTRYGPLTEIWFDGGFPTPEGEWRYGYEAYARGPNIKPIIDEHQPDMVVMQGPLSMARWSGTESGAAWYPSWSTIPDAMAERRAKPEDERYEILGHGIPGSASWIPAECCTTLRKPHEWFWRPEGQTLKSVDHLVGLYYRSAGRNANLLLNAAPDKDGLIPDEDMVVYEALGKELKRRFENCVGETSGEGNEIELRFDEPRVFDHVVIMEDIAQGERIREYVVEAHVDGLFGDWPWFELCRGTCVGHKRIHLLPPFETTAIRLRCKESVAQPKLRRLALYYAGTS